MVETATASHSPPLHSDSGTGDGGGGGLKGLYHVVRLKNVFEMIKE